MALHQQASECLRERELTVKVTACHKAILCGRYEVLCAGAHYPSRPSRKTTTKTPSYAHGITSSQPDHLPIELGVIEAASIVVKFRWSPNGRVLFLQAPRQHGCRRRYSLWAADEPQLFSMMNGHPGRTPTSVDMSARENTRCCEQRPSERFNGPIRLEFPALWVPLR